MRKGVLSTVARSVASVFKASVPVTQMPPGLSWGGFWGPIREGFAGAWQQGTVVADPHHSLLAFSAVYACITLISDDISKLRPKLMALDASGVWQETTNPAFSPVLRKPNHYQTRIQFLSGWVVSRLLHGNVFVLKERDARGVVTALYLLDPRLVKPLVAETGDVFYSINVGTSDPVGRPGSFTVPASEVIHDRAVCLFHPLVGVPPIFACGISATQGNRIQGNSAKFFENMSRPSGMLTAPNTITDETARRLKADFEANFSGSNLGRLLVTGDGLTYSPMTIPAEQAQLIEQLRWTVEDVARAFHVPLHKIASDSGVKYNNMAAMNQDYYSLTLQALIESIELLLDEGLGLAGGANVGVQTLGVELDLEGLLRMDPVQRAQRNQIGMDAGYLAPDEARASENLMPLPGGSGKEPFMQQQKFPLSVLVQQPAPGSTPPAAPPAAAPATEPAPPPDDGATKQLVDALASVNTLFERVQAAETARAERSAEEIRARAEAEAADREQRAAEAAAQAATEEEARKAALTAIQDASSDFVQRVEAAAVAEQQLTQSLGELVNQVAAEREAVQRQADELETETVLREVMQTITKGLEHV